MPIVKNPAIAQGIANLAKMFEPPSGTDAYGWARANAENAKESRLTELYNGVDQPGFDANAADQRAVLLGLYTPTQSRYAVDQNTATTQRGQDVSARTSLANNAADNVRALEDRRLQEAGALQRQFAEPIKLGQGDRAYLPAATAGATGLDPVLDGAPKPLSESEMVGAIIGDMPATDRNRLVEQKYAMSDSQVKGDITKTLVGSGTLSQDQINDLVLGQPEVEQVVGPDNKPQIVTRAQAVGREPFINRGAEAAPKTSNYQTPAGEMGNAVFDNQQRAWVDAATRAPLPPGATLFTGELSGSGAETGFGAQKQNLTAATNLESSLDEAQFIVNGMRKILAENPNVAGIPGEVKRVVQSLTSSAQQVANAYAQQAPDAVMRLDEVQQIATQALGPDANQYDPNIVRLQSSLYDLAYKRAQINNPTGEVSRQAFERALQSFGQTFLSSQQDMSTALDAFEQDTISAGRVKVNSLRGQRGDLPANAPPSAPTDAGNPVISAARAAIAKGAPREAVIQRLRDNSIDPGNL